MTNLEEVYFRVLEQSSNLILVTDTQGRIEYANPKMLQRTGYTFKELAGKTPRIFKSGKLPDKTYAELWSSLKAGGAWKGELENRNKAGEPYWVRANIGPIKDESGKITHFLSIQEDITEVKKAREAALAQERFSRNLLDNSLDLLSVYDLQGRYLFQSQSSEAITGFTSTELEGTVGYDRMHPEDAAKIREVQQWCLAHPGQGASARYRSRHKDGTWRTFDAAGKYVGGTPPSFIVNARDVTESLALENQYRQAQKMESIGQLAGGVAHDFNNLLTAVLGYCSFLLEDTPDADPRRKDIEEIQRTAYRAADLTRQLLAFSRRQIFSPKVVDLGKLVLNMDKLLRRLVNENIEVVILPSEKTLAVMVDPGQIEQVVVNLAVNARDAMPKGGKISIEIEPCRVAAAEIESMPGMVPGDFVRLILRDTGSGMSQETLGHLFEPFFTTKEKGKGTGLGLATCYGIVKQSGGHIHCQSEIGRGSAFSIYLPAAEGAPVDASHEVSKSEAPKGSETILLAEDEPAVRNMAVRILSGLGYRVLAAANGDEALRVFEKFSKTDAIGLLFTDVVMPQMGGKELADEIRKRAPGLKVLFSSGYTDAAIIESGSSRPADFLPKPYTAASLARKIRDALDGKPS